MRLKIPEIDRIVLLGGGKLLVALVRWCQSEGAPISVVTSPRHAEELIDENQTLLKFLEKNSVEYLVTSDISSEEASQFLSDLSQAFCLSLGAAWIFREQTLENIFQNRLFNLHGTRLPQNRGGGGYSWQILMGNRLGFCQLHLVDSGVDTGDLVRTTEFLYPPHCRLPKDYGDLSYKEKLNFVLDFIEEIREGGVIIDTVRQSECFSTYWPRLNTSINGWIDWKESISSVEKFICAFDDPYEGAKTFLNDEKVFIKDVMMDFSDPSFHTYQAGIVFRKGSCWISVCANGGTLIVQNMLNEDGENLINKVKIGDRLTTPISYLESRQSRVIYTPMGVK